MPPRNWLDCVEFELARRGVPARFRRRLLAELRDHADDFKDEEGATMDDRRMETRLGEPGELAARAAEQYRRATWVSRHPLLMFGLLPVPSAIVMVLATVMVFSLALLAVEAVTDQLWAGASRSAVVISAYALAWLVRLVPFIFLTAIYTRWYLRHSVHRWWFAVAAIQILLFAGSTLSLVNYSDEPGQSSWILGFAWLAFPTDNGWILPFLQMVGWGQLINVLVPVACGVLLLRIAHRRQLALAAC